MNSHQKAKQVTGASRSRCTAANLAIVAPVRASSKPESAKEGKIDTICDGIRLDPRPLRGTREVLEVNRPDATDAGH
jgi:hypothetical protein